MQPVFVPRCTIEGPGHERVSGNIRLVSCVPLFKRTSLLSTGLRFFVLGIFLTCRVLYAHGQGSAFQFLNKPGRYPVGLKVVEQFDVSRSYPAVKGTSTGEGRRPLQTLIWYPSTPNQRETLTVEAYVRLADSETQFAIPAERN